MLCTLKVRRSQQADEDERPYCLQITSKHAVGGAGGRISDELSFSTLPELLQVLSDLQLPGDSLHTGHATVELERAQDRWLPVATGVQIAFETLTAAGFDLDDEGN